MSRHWGPAKASTISVSCRAEIKPPLGRLRHRGWTPPSSKVSCALTAVALADASRPSLKGLEPQGRCHADADASSVLRQLVSLARFSPVLARVEAEPSRDCIGYPML